MSYCPDCRCCHWASLLLEGCRWDTLLILHPMTSIDTTWFVQPIQSTTLLQSFMYVPVFCICSLHMGCSNTSCYYHLPGLSSNWVAIVHPDVFDICCCSFTNTLSKIIFKIEVRGEVKSKLLSKCQICTCVWFKSCHQHTEDLGNSSKHCFVSYESLLALSSLSFYI